jgi:pilus assembly protein CpaE
LDEVRIVLGLEEHAVTEEVMHLLDRSGKARVIATASDERQLAEAVRQLEPDVIVASMALVPEPIGDPPLLAVETQESVRSLRRAIGIGASGYFLWPREREALVDATVRARRPLDVVPSAPVVAVLGACGGVGTTFVATHLAAALARRSLDCALVDLEVAFAGVSGPLGVPDDGIPSAADLVRFGEEAAPSQVRDLLWRHPEGFGTLLSPGRADAISELGAVAYGRAIAALSASVSVVVLHVPREIGALTRMALVAADPILLVLRLDATTLRSAGRLIEATGIADRCRLVVNQARRSRLTPRDLERALGLSTVTVIPNDRRVAEAMEAGRLVSRRGRLGRAIDRLADGSMAVAS